MTRPHWLRRAAVATCCAMAMLAAASAYGASAVSYRGATSQGRAISFTIARGHVTRLAFRIVDKCSSGEPLVVHAYGFAPIKITHNSFAVTVTTHPGEPTVVRGKLSGDQASGSLRDTSVDVGTGDVCKGAATFVAHVT